jgi:hypothetical protein
VVTPFATAALLAVALTATAASLTTVTCFATVALSRSRVIALTVFATLYARTAGAVTCAFITIAAALTRTGFWGRSSTAVGYSKFFLN